MNMTRQPDSITKKFNFVTTGNYEMNTKALGLEWKRLSGQND
jgi:hypothetical protein